MQLRILANSPARKPCDGRWESFARRAMPLLLFALGVVAAGGATAESAFDEANKLYEQGKYTEAANGYEKILQSGQVSAAVLYNLGNAFFKSGQLGRAIATYRRAQQLAPRDPDLR